MNEYGRREEEEERTFFLFLPSQSLGPEDTSILWQESLTIDGLLHIPDVEDWGRYKFWSARLWPRRVILPFVQISQLLPCFLVAEEDLLSSRLGVGAKTGEQWEVQGDWAPCGLSFVDTFMKCPARRGCYFSCLVGEQIFPILMSTKRRSSSC